jgi:hypothetical protein
MDRMTASIRIGKAVGDPDRVDAADGGDCPVD